MQSSFIRRTLPRSIIALAVLALGVFLSRADSASAAGTFTASSVTTLSSTAAGANADLTVVLGIPLNDYNFSAVINGTPGQAVVAKGPGYPGYSAVTEPALGDVVGTLASNSTLGLTGNPCTGTVSPNFVFLNATVNNAASNEIDPVPQASTNPGSGATLDNLWSDNGSSTTGPDATSPWQLPWGDTEGPGFLPHGAGSALSAAERTNGLPAQVDRYPSYLNILFDPDYTGGDPFAGAQPVQPRARYAGATNVVGTSVVLDLVVFAPGALSSAFAAPHPFNATSPIGYTTIAVLNDSTVPASHGSISDFCSPLDTTAITYGMAKTNPCNVAVPPAGCISATQISNPAPGAGTKARYANPADGVYIWESQHQSLRDADSDGIENSLDACPTTADTYNPRTDTGADADNDGLPDVCDPNDSDGNTDNDGDGWENSYDNCALVSNITQADGEVNVAYATTAPSGGPRGDSIGDDCDADDVISNGAFMSSTTDSCITIGSGGGACIMAGVGDFDGDGYLDLTENVIGTNWQLRCNPAVTGLPNPNWPSDLAASSFNKISIADVTSFTSPAPKKLNTVPGNPGYNKRWDIKTPFNAIVLGDLTTLTAGAIPSPNRPPMFGVARAFNGPTCTP